MHISTHLNAEQQIRILLPQELDLGLKILRTNLNLQPNEKVLVVTDLQMLQKEAAIWFESAKQITSNVTLIVIEGLTHSGQTPSQDVIDACTQADVVVLQTSYSLTHTEASRAARNQGARVASLPTVNHELIMRTLTQDYQPIKELGTKLKNKLSQGRELKITSKFGTNLTTTIRQGLVIDDNGFIYAGEVGNLPAGEVFFCPIDKTTNGTWVVNGSLADAPHLDQPVTLHIENGIVVKIDGGRAAANLQEKLTTIGPDAFMVAEIGIGTNPAADPTASIIEAEKAYGTAHLAVGNSASIGGTNTAPIHLDGVTLSPTITIDNQVILANSIFDI